MSEKILYTISEAAHLVSFSRATLYKDIRNNLLPVVKRGRSVRILRSELLRYAARLRKNSSPKIPCEPPPNDRKPIIRKERHSGRK